MDLVLLSRIQFALTISFHYIFPPLSIGLGVLLVIMEGMYLWTKNPVYHQMARFWVRIFGLTFTLGVASGIVMEFQFGTNWSGYSRFVGDVFGSALAAEGIFAFFLESVFLAILLFAWNKVSPCAHFFSTVMVMLGAHLSAVWIIVAGSWMQTPAGFHIVGEGVHARAEITSFLEVVFNPSSMNRLQHTLLGAWQAGSFFVISVSAYYLLKRRHEDVAKAMMKIALVLAFVASLGSLVTGHESAKIVAEYQPAKLAAMEGHFPESGKADLHLFGWVDLGKSRVIGPKIPGMLSFLVHGNFTEELPGLHTFVPEDWPPVQPVFQAFHLMVGIGFLLLFLSVLGLFFWWRDRLFDQKWLLRVFMISVLAAQAANQMGWFTTEVGRQPWIVYGVLRTAEAVSKSVPAQQVLISLLSFSMIYILLFGLFIYLLMKKIQYGLQDGV